MSEPLPIACSLSTDALADRIGWIASLNRGSLRGHRLQRGTLRLLYDVAAAEDVRMLVEREQECCGFLRFAIEESNDGIELCIEALVQNEIEVDPLFAPFLSGVPTPSMPAR
jgi:hypothetical protein